MSTSNAMDSRPRIDTGPPAVVTATPAAAAGCSDRHRGTTSDHNESAGRDRGRRRRGRRLVVALATATALVGGVLVVGSTAKAIVGGTAVHRNTYPYFVQVLTKRPDNVNAYKCGGSIIAPGVVLTAAHCVAGGTSVEVHISQPNFTGKEPAWSFVKSPLYDDPWCCEPMTHDLALVYIDPAKTAGVVPPQVGAPGDPGAFAPGNPAVVVGTGWQYWEDSSLSRPFKELRTQLRSDDYMDDVYNPAYYWDKWYAGYHIGAGSEGQTVCKGDSGGPLTVQRASGLVQVGVASFTKDGCREPGGFAELGNTSQLAWIAERVPSIESRWGSCVTPSGSSGRWDAYFHKWFEATGQKTGDYYWDIRCVTTQTSTATPRPSPTSRPPSEDVCMQKPWTPGCE